MKKEIVQVIKSYSNNYYPQSLINILKRLAGVTGEEREGEGARGFARDGGAFAVGSAQNRLRAAAQPASWRAPRSHHDEDGAADITSH